jgi:hypothetical protein
MAVQFGDSTDHYDLQSTIPLKWNEAILGSASSAVAPPGRGPRAILLKNGIFKTLTYQTKWFTGFALYINNVVSGANVYSLSAAFSNSATLATLNTQDDGTLSIFAGNSLNLIGNSASVGLTLFADVWNYIEIGVTLSGTTPIMATVTLRVNGIQILTGTASTGVNAASTLIGTNQANVHAYTFNTTAGSAYARDFYIADGSGAGSVNGFIGDIALSALFPRADVTMAWTAVGGTGSTGWNHVNPQFPETNDDTIYIEDDNPTDVANFLWQPITPFTGTIPFIHYGVYHRKDAEGTRTFQQTTHGVANGPSISPGDSYQYNFFAMDQDPATTLPWTQANFNASQFGLVITS